jgi:hypothetical protein
MRRFPFHSPYRKTGNPLILILVFSTMAVALPASTNSLTAEASLSSRWARPRQVVELLISIRNAKGLPVVSPLMPRGMVCSPLKTCQRVKMTSGEVFLFRYRIDSAECGNYEIPPIMVSDTVSTVRTRPLFIRVSNDGKPHSLSGKELGLAASIPVTLAEEAAKLQPVATSTPVPSPPPVHSGNFATTMVSILGEGLRKFWDYPGK